MLLSTPFTLASSFKWLPSRSRIALVSKSTTPVVVNSFWAYPFLSSFATYKSPTVVCESPFHPFVLRGVKVSFVPSAFTNSVFAVARPLTYTASSDTAMPYTYTGLPFTLAEEPATGVWSPTISRIHCILPSALTFITSTL